jgi:hypothetical protein
MGQRKGLVYNVCVISLLLGVCYLTTSNIGYTPCVLPEVQDTSSILNLQPILFNLIVSTEEKFELPDEIKKKLESISNQFSQFWDIKVFLSSVVSADTKKVKSTNIGPIETKTIVFVVSPGYQQVRKENFYWISSTGLDMIPSIFISILRQTAGLTKTDEPLNNGLTNTEIQNSHQYVLDWVKSSLNKEIRIYNLLNLENKPVITGDLYNYIIRIRESIGNHHSVEELYGLYRSVRDLNRNKELAMEEYFQWDFKLGVYGPLFFPVLFPMTAAVYSRLFLRK